MITSNGGREKIHSLEYYTPILSKNLPLYLGGQEQCAHKGVPKHALQSVKKLVFDRLTEIKEAAKTSNSNL